MVEEKNEQDAVKVCDSEEKSCKSGKCANKVVVGVVLLALGLLAVIGWWNSVTTIFKGLIGIVLLLAGAVTIAIAKE